MIVCYRIFEWDQLFENNRTRGLKTMTWVPTPNKHDGDGYTQLASHPEFPSIFGVWNVILQVASKCDPRGTLVRQGRNGLREAHDAASLSRITRFPVAAIEVGIARLLVVGWLEAVDLSTGAVLAISQDGAVLPHGDALTPHDDEALRARAGAHSQKGREGREGREGTDGAGAREDRDNKVASSFDRLLAVYPKKIDIPKAQRAYLLVLNELPPEDQLLRVVQAWAASADWKREGGRYVPKLDNWLDRRGWKEPVPETAVDGDRFRKTGGDEGRMNAYKNLGREVASGS